MNFQVITNFRSAFICIALATLLSACATQSPPSSAYRTERVSGGGVSIENLQIKSIGNGLQVYGTVRRTIGYAYSPRRHLYVESISPDGNVLWGEEVRFNTNPLSRIRHSRVSSRYSVTIPEKPPIGSLIRVTVHTTSASEHQK